MPRFSELEPSLNLLNELGITPAFYRLLLDGGMFDNVEDHAELEQQLRVHTADRKSSARDEHSYQSVATGMQQTSSVDKQIVIQPAYLRATLGLVARLYPKEYGDAVGNLSQGQIGSMSEKALSRLYARVLQLRSQTEAATKSYEQNRCTNESGEEL